MANPTPHRTPLRRISRGSLFALSRSQRNTDAPHGLGFLEPALAELVDETEQLSVTAEGITKLTESVATFNESFASWLHVMDMNSLTLDWPQFVLVSPFIADPSQMQTLQAPTDNSFHLAEQRVEQDILVAAQQAAKESAARAAAALSAALLAKQESMPDVTGAEMTYAGNTTAVNVTTTSSGSGVNPKMVKKAAKAKLTSKEKKERAMAIDRVVTCLPLEFRGNDITLRRNMEMVVESLMYGDGGGVRLHELISPPDLNQARVNKCLIALVNRKVVQKDSSSGTVLYYWQGVPG